MLGSILDRGQLLQPRQRSCGVGQDYVVIDQRGTGREVPHGDRADPRRRFPRRSAAAGPAGQDDSAEPAVEEKEGCRDCRWRYWCSGGCSVATFRATGRYDIKSPNCNIYKAIYPEALRLEGLRLLKYAGNAVV